MVKAKDLSHALLSLDMAKAMLAKANRGDYPRGKALAQCREAHKNLRATAWAVERRLRKIEIARLKRRIAAPSPVRSASRVTTIRQTHRETYRGQL